MNSTIVFTFIGADKPGLIEKLSNTVSEHGGNWLESRMSQLAGNFAGITRVQVATDQADTLKQALANLSDGDLNITFRSDIEIPAVEHHKRLNINLLGNDRPGIVKELTHALAQLQINVCEMNTNVTSAPMTADPLFVATAEVQIPPGLNLNELNEKLEEIANELDVDITTED